MSIRAIPPPSPQEIHRKLSVHAKPKKLSVSPGSAMSGTESDSDSQLAGLDAGSPAGHGGGGGAVYASGAQPPPLQSIAERRSGSGDESDEDEDEGGAWRVAGQAARREDEETVVKSGYLWKKGSRRKTWKKRWFVLRAPHLAYYKTSAEYELLRLLDLHEVHSVTPVALKKHRSAFGVVLPTRTFYLQAESDEQVAAWVRALGEVRERLQTTGSVTPVPTPPIAIPGRGQGGPRAAEHVAASPPNLAITSSDEDEVTASSPGAARGLAPAKGLGTPVGNDATKVILSGYLMKCGKRKSWRKRWFMLTGEKLLYCGNHMDSTKHQRQIPLAQVLDAMEYAIPNQRHAPPAQTPPGAPPVHALDELTETHHHHAHAENHTFKIVTTKRSIMLCAPSEEEEIRWLSAVRALIARRAGGAAGSTTGGTAGSTTGGTVGGTGGATGGTAGTVAGGTAAAVAGTGRRRSVSTGLEMVRV